MILGNSNGNNKGKKYFKSKDICESKCFSEKSDKFNTWFIQNINALKTQLFNKYTHTSNCDIFNDTYMRIYERVHYTGFDIADYKSYFCRAFYTNYIQELSKGNRYADLACIDSMEDELDDLCGETEVQHKLLESKIFDYVYHNFDIREYEIFKMYMQLKIQGKSMNYQILADIINNKDYKVHTIQAIISKIKKKVHCQFAPTWQQIC
ncbi:MAG: hypothetical protein RL662_761 [Bacteroidota bacterium]|jgi:hypothetical protein